ncbi:AAA domain-containing protein [Glycomyces arizonensis]|uniref:AAA domain-containing protein n=1 Tax=Glycomyces arizonensis TaxID=256035 RepID=UPI000412708B|nr:AAA domain-containing protein [Glycomyces arizonensis]
MSVSELLSALADLAPAAKAPTFDRIGAKTAWGTAFETAEGGEDLEAYDELHRDERLLRQGWGVVMGRFESDGKTHRVRYPLVSRPVRLSTPIGGAQRQDVTPAGDVAVCAELAETEFAPVLEAVFDPERRAALLEDTDWLLKAAAAAGFPDASIRDDPPQRERDRLVLVPRPVVYIDREAAPTPIASGLRLWAERPGLDDTALAALYTPRDSPTAEAAPERPRCALPLSREQTAALAAARTEAVTVVAGAPGCGKSHTLAAVALDTVAAGQSVLIATQSVHAADVIAALLDRHPGPLPVQFGDSERRDEFTTRLGSGVDKGLRRREVDRHARAAADALDYAGSIEREIARRLDLESRRARALDAPAFVLDEFPGLKEADLDEAERLARRAHGDDAHWWSALLRRLARRRLRAVTGADGPAAALHRALEAARDHRAMTLLAAEGTDLAPLWHSLENADRDAAAALGTALRTETGSAERRSGPSRRALADLAAALRVGDRVRRRAALAAVDAEAMLRAMPLWMGTVGDAEDLLPATAGMFDVVILDEASHINQLWAAPVLARARRAVVAGDPRQLRFVSFAGEERLNEVLGAHGLEDRHTQLDTRRVSAYDLACGAGPVVELTEHHRSVPHLIGFSAAKFYHGRVKPITTHPRNHDADAIAVHRVKAAKSSPKGVLKAEVDRSVELLAEFVERGETGLAVLSPFRAQAEAIEAAIVKRFDVATIRARRIRAGTVHAFQGSEAETVIASLGAADGDPAGRRRFVANPNLFNVMITRARAGLHVVTALSDPDGLVGEFLAYADHPPASPLDGETGRDEWTAAVADAIAASGTAVRRAYPAGHWSVDLAVGDGEAAVGVICAVHPEGPEAHLARHRALRRAGWRLVDAFPSTFAADAARAAVTVLADLPRR